MYNHSDVWKNITMIIFYVLIICFILILFLRQNVYFEFCIDGLKSKLYIRWGFFKIKRYGDFVLKTKNSSQLIQQNEIIHQNKLTHKSKEKFTNKFKSKTLYKKSSFAKISNEKMKKNIKKKRREKLKIFIGALKCLTFESLAIYEEIGLLAPDKTALFLPVVSSITTIPLQFLCVKTFEYKIIPKYDELKFYTKITTKISFRIIDLICCIIKEFLHKLLYSNNFLRRKKYE